MSPPAFTIVGAPIDSVGLGHDAPHGTELSPAALRAAGLARLEWPDLGDLPVRIPDHERDPDTGLVGRDGVLSTTTTIRTAIAGLCADGERPFVVGGCCTIAAGALAGARDALGPVGLIYVDGHLDLFDGTSSPTGEAADMPLAVILGDGPLPWVERVAPVPVTPPSAVALLGFRDDEELAILRDRLAGHLDADLLAVSADAIHVGDAGDIGAVALDHVTRATEHAWLHIDLDVLDEAVFPATDYLQPGGLDWSQLVALVRAIVSDPRLVGWSIACYNPEKDPDGADAAATVRAIADVVGRDLDDASAHR